MRLFGFRKKKVLDLTEPYKKQQEKLEQMKEDQQESPTSFLGSLASGASSSETSSDYIDVSGGMQEKRKRLAKRIMDMTSKMEDFSNQIYHLQQRVEVLEKKLKMSFE